MRTDAFVLVSENRVELLAPNKKRLTQDFCSDDYSNYDEYVAAVICSMAKNIGGNISSVRLVLPSAYYDYDEQVEQGTRQSKDEKYRIVNFSSPLSSVSNTDVTSYFESYTYYECEGKSYMRLEDVPLLHKYLKRRSFMHWDQHRLSSIVSQLSRLGIEVVSVAPDIHVYNSLSRCYSGCNAVISIFERFTDVCVFSEGNVRHMARLQFGLFDIVRKLSNTFNLSYNNCRMLMNMYGFVFVPQPFVNYEVAVPVFEDIKKRIKLTDISFEIREMLKAQFSEICNCLKKYEVDDVICKGLPVVDANVLLQMMIKSDCSCVGDMHFDDLEKVFVVLDKNSHSETLVYEPKPEEKKMTNEAQPKAKETDTPQQKSLWFDGLMGKLNQSKEKITSKLNTIIVELD